MANSPHNPRKQSIILDYSFYIITISTNTPDKFFKGEANPDFGQLDPHILAASLGSSEEEDPTISLPTRIYLSYLNSAVSVEKGTDDSGDRIADFMRETLEVLKYKERGSVSVSYEPITFRKSCAVRSTQLDVCLRHYRALILLIVKTIFVSGADIVDQEKQVIEHAIAVFQKNNKMREGCGLARLDSMTIPCILMDFTRADQK